MENESTSFPEKNSDTPEAIQECFELKEAIDGHLDNWYEHSIAHHPIMRGLLSKTIIHECQPLDADIDDLVTAARFRQGLSSEDEYYLRLALEHRKLIAPIVNDTSLDAIEIKNPSAGDPFKFVRSTRDHPSSNPEFVQAFDYLYRLCVKREQVSDALGNKDSFQTASEFSQIIHGIFEERYLHSL